MLTDFYNLDLHLAHGSNQKGCALLSENRFVIFFWTLWCSTEEKFHVHWDEKVRTAERAWETAIAETTRVQGTERI